MGIALKARRRSGDSSHRRPNAPLTAAERRLATLFQDAANLLAAGADNDAVRAAIRRANITEAMDAMPWAQHDALIGEAAETIEQEMGNAGSLLNGNLPNLQPLPTSMAAAFTFNKVDPRALAWAQAQAAALVTSASDSTRAAVRKVIADSFRENLTIPETTARIQSTIGLTEKGAETVTRLQDRVFTELLAGGMDPATAGSRAFAQAMQMRTRLLKARAETIARTEVLRANNNGRYLGWTQAAEEGYIPNDAMKKWSSTTASLSGIACERCRPMHGEIVLWTDSFSNGVNMPPAHPNCRCTALLVPPQPEQRRTGVNQETDYSTAAPKPVGVAPASSARGGSTPQADIGVPKERRAGMGDIPIPAKQLRGGSAEPFLNPDGTFTPERQAFHDDIVARAVDGIPPARKGTKPEFEMLGGGAGAGKSTVLKSGVADVRDRGSAVHINADDIKELIPEVKVKQEAGETDWAAFSHEESSYLAKRVLSAATERRQHVVLDGTGDGSVASVVSKTSAARRAGYKVKATYVTIDADEAVRRATKRAAETGRAVPETIIRGTHKGVSEIFPQVYGEFDEFVVVDNNGLDPRVISRGSNGQIEIVDEEAWAAFLAKGTQ